MCTNACSSTFIFSVMISDYSWFYMKVIVTWWIFLSPWVTLTLWIEVFSYNFDVKNLIVKFDFNEHQLMCINFHLFSVNQWIFLIFHVSYSYLMIFSASMSDIKIIERSVFIQFGYVEYNGAICFEWAPIHVHQLSFNSHSSWSCSWGGSYCCWGHGGVIQLSMGLEGVWHCQHWKL